MREHERVVFTVDGQTLDVVTVEAAQARRVSHRDVLHARELSV